MALARAHANDVNLRGGRRAFRAISGGRRNHGHRMTAARQFTRNIRQQNTRRRLRRREKLIDEHNVHGAARRAANFFSNTLARTCSM